MEHRSPVFTIFIYLCALLLAVLILAPFAWLFIMSISSTNDLISKPLRWWPEQADWSRYQLLTDMTPNTHGAALMSALKNSILVAAIATLAALVVSVPTRWALSRSSAVDWSLGVVIGSYMLPPVALAVPL